MKRLVNGYWCEPETGAVFGKRVNRPIGSKNSQGYILIRKENGISWWMAHRMIWESVHGPIPDGLQINHINGMKHDNRIANLELTTPSENTRHAYRTGLASHEGSKNSNAKLDESKVLAIRSSGHSLSQLAREFGVSRRTIKDVMSRRAWRHVA